MHKLVFAENPQNTANMLQRFSEVGFKSPLPEDLPGTFPQLCSVLEMP
jgi:hypothetical protein